MWRGAGVTAAKSISGSSCKLAVCLMTYPGPFASQTPAVIPCIIYSAAADWPAEVHVLT
jgi:hypothetical protein